jgi:hypothetical protein
MSALILIDLQSDFSAPFKVLSMYRRQGRRSLKKLKSQSLTSRDLVVFGKRNIDGARA